MSKPIHLHHESQKTFEIRPRSHPDFDLHYFDAGQFQFMTGGETVPVSPGDLVFSPPGQVAGFRKTGVGSISIFHCHFEFGLLKYESIDGPLQAWAHLRAKLAPTVPGFSRALHLPDRHSVLDRVAWNESFLRLLREYAEAKPGFELAAEACLLVLLQEVSREVLASLVPANRPIKLTRAHLHVRRSLELIERHLAEPFSLYDVAGRLQMSTEYLARIFKLFTGSTVGAYILHRKTAAAKERLLAPGASIKGVAASLGYRDPLYFSRQFRKTEGLSPSEFVLRNAR